MIITTKVSYDILSATWYIRQLDTDDNSSIEMSISPQEVYPFLTQIETYQPSDVWQTTVDVTRLELYKIPAPV